MFPKVSYQGGNTGKGPSPGVWWDCPIVEMTEDPGVGFYIFDDFLGVTNVGATETTETSLVGGPNYKCYSKDATGTTVAQSLAATVKGGGILTLLGNSDNDNESVGQWSPPFLITGVPSTSKKLWFEARVAVTSIATAMTHVFVGLAETKTMTFSDGIPLGGGDATSNTGSLLGFNRLEDGLAVINTSYTDRATSYTDIQASAGAFVANTWIKLGMVYDPSSASKAVRFFVDGVETTTPMTLAAIVATTNLKANSLGFCIAQYSDTSGTACYLYCDWWRGAQLRL
jgi:hypothetical protein